jgi:hypothetical protein
MLLACEVPVAVGLHQVSHLLMQEVKAKPSGLSVMRRSRHRLGRQ